MTDLTTRHPSRSPHRRRGEGRASQAGQAALGIVLGITVMLATGAGILATSVIERDPLVQSDVVQHYAYRALEAGVNTFLNNVNDDPNLMNCNATSVGGGQCDPTEYNTWKQVQGTTGPGVVPEWYLWQNPVFCFDQACTVTGNSTLPILYAKITVIGGAGFPGHMSYQSSVANMKPENGFLTRVWWSNYEATDPALGGYPTSDCTQDYLNAYNGPNTTTGTTACSAVYFGPGDQIYGPLFSNDSMYVFGNPTLGPVQTADPNCLYTTGTGGKSASCATSDGSGAGQIVTQSAADAAASAYNQAVEPLPTTNSALATYASLNGCLYQGPTTFAFDGNDQMTVWSPDTPLSSKCLVSQGGVVNVPNGAHGNGVIYVQSVGNPANCQPGANPFDNYTAGGEGPQAQWGYDGTYFDFFGWQPQPDCEGDAFVSDNPTGGGISGQLTIGTANNVVITGNIKYQDCGANFDSTVNHPCIYNSSTTNDVLGLIATNYVEVNHPVKPNCTTIGGSHPQTTCTGVSPSSVLEPLCSTTPSVLGTPAAALCDPGPNVTIDAAVLALHHSFTVNNEGLNNGSSYGVGSPESTLTVYGAIDQDWRGAVGVGSGAGLTSGYTKDYDWDSRIQVVTPPHYLTPGTPSWALVSSATIFGQSPPACCGAPPS